MSYFLIFLFTIVIAFLIHRYLIKSKTSDNYTLTTLPNWIAIVSASTSEREKKRHCFSIMYQALSLLKMKQKYSFNQFTHISSQPDFNFINFVRILIFDVFQENIMVRDPEDALQALNTLGAREIIAISIEFILNSYGEEKLIYLGKISSGETINWH